MNLLNLDCWLPRCAFKILKNCPTNHRFPRGWFVCLYMGPHYVVEPGLGHLNGLCFLLLLFLPFFTTFTFFFFYYRAKTITKLHLSLFLKIVGFFCTTNRTQDLVLPDSCYTTELHFHPKTVFWRHISLHFSGCPPSSKPPFSGTWVAGITLTHVPTNHILPF